MKRTTRVAIPEPILRLQKQLEEFWGSESPASMRYGVTHACRKLTVHAHVGIVRRASRAAWVRLASGHGW